MALLGFLPVLFAESCLSLPHLTRGERSQGSYQDTHLELNPGFTPVRKGTGPYGLNRAPCSCLVTSLLGPVSPNKPGLLCESNETTQGGSGDPTKCSGLGSAQWCGAGAFQGTWVGLGAFVQQEQSVCPC